MRYDYHIDNDTKAIFKAYLKHKNVNENKDYFDKDFSFINNIEKLKMKKLKEIFYDLNNLDYERGESIPKSIGKYQLINKIIEKMDRLESFFLIKVLTKKE